MTEIRPDYYKSGEMEAFDVIDAFNLNFNLGNAFKYIVRANRNYDKIKDLRKAITYLDREIEKAKKEREALYDAFKDLTEEKSDCEAGRRENL